MNSSPNFTYLLSSVKLPLNESDCQVVVSKFPEIILGVIVRCADLPEPTEPRKSRPDSRKFSTMI